MEEKEVEACVFTSIHNTAYFSNYVYCSMGRPYGLVVGHAGKGTTISSLVDGGHPLRTWGDYHYAISPLPNGNALWHSPIDLSGP